ncbi:MAG: preprotein translocase subunit SecE [Bacteroidales bacterium]|nr:preprotein translocase subunit SecE [Bacteroidales bacterium]MDY3912081.1 preprotein translocase subunit SecE [Sodaliphilus sp.]
MKKYKILTDLEESYYELVNKVSWPTKKELANSSVVVMVASIVAALVIWAVDAVINEGMHLIYSIPSQF